MVVDEREVRRVVRRLRGVGSFGEFILADGSGSRLSLEDQLKDVSLTCFSRGWTG